MTAQYTPMATCLRCGESGPVGTPYCDCPQGEPSGYIESVTVAGQEQPDVNWKLISLRQQPAHAPMWPGKHVAVFARDPMTYVFVYNEDTTCHKWPSSLDRETGQVLRALLPIENGGQIP